MVRTDAFKNWFGDWQNDPANASKVVDENGEPKVVTHSTPNQDSEGNKYNYPPFNIFDGNRIFNTPNSSVIPIWFSFYGNYAVNKTIVNMPFFLNIKNLFLFNDKKHLKKLQDYMIEKYNNYDVDLEYDYNNNWEAIENENLPAYISEIGFDGYKTDSESAIAIFKSEQGKLADGSNTTFDSSNPDIRYAGGGKVKKVKFDIDDDEEEERVTISIKGIGQVVLVETFPEYEFIDDIDEDTLEELGVEEGDIIGKIEHLEIEDKYKGQGYAKLLMNKAIEVAKEKGLMPLYLNASPMGINGLDINDLTAFYESFGFEVFLEQGNNNLMILK